MNSTVRRRFLHAIARVLTRVLIPGLIVMALAGCATLSAQRTVPVQAGALWSVSPFIEAPQASGAARQLTPLLESALRQRGVTRIERAGSSSVLTHRYALQGTVLRWQAPRRPGEGGTVALDIVLRDLQGGPPLWQRSGSRHGGAREGMTAVAKALLDELLPALDSTSTKRRTLQGVDAQAGRAVGEAVGGPSVSFAASAGTAMGLRTASGASVGPPSGTATGMPMSMPMSMPVADRATADALSGRSTALFYADALPVASLAQFDRVVLEPDNTDAGERRAVAADGAALFAYLSIGEVGPERAWRPAIDARWVLGRNPAWDSQVMDLAHPGWADFVVARVDDLVQDGYHGLFLDTMDSFTLHAAAPAQRRVQAEALAALIERIVQRHPDIRLIANRGFEVLDAVGEHLEALAAESLYANWDNTAQRYGSVPASDRDWLLARLQEAQRRHGLDIIAIDYVSPARRDEARAVAQRIAAHGFVPWVATPGLDHVGVGALDVLPREVLLPYDSRVNGAQENAEVHRLLATPLEYLGYVPVYHDLATQGLPPNSLGGRYAGVAFWSRGVQLDDQLQAWLVRQVGEGVRIALLGSHSLVTGSALATATGVTSAGAMLADSTVVRHQDALAGFEQGLPPRFEPLGPQPRNVDPGNRVHVSLVDADGSIADPVITGAWGGMAAHPALIEVDVDDGVRWIIDPFRFLSLALDLQRAPMPDVTSQGDKRLWLAHIDGDALPSWSELPGRRLGAEVIRDRILDRWPLPHTLSVVEAELTHVAGHGDRRERMYRTVRELFARPGIELASHTFSHPFLWGALAQAPTSGTFNLPVGDYRYSAEREVAGSAAFIDRELAPPGKRTEVMLWSGDALPDEAALAAAEAAGLANMNGGFTVISRARPHLNLVTPMARTVGDHVQVYAPVMNENVYTNDWQGPFDGFRRVIETFRMTDRPRRLKPINIYYHFYAGTKAAAVRSLEDVYAWTMTQDIHPVTLVDYTARVRRFRSAGVARTLDGRFRLSGLGELTSLRLVGGSAGLDDSRSEGVASSHRLHDGLYLTVLADGPVLVALEDDAGMTLSEVDDAAQ